MGQAEFGYGDANTGYGYHANVNKYYTQAELQKDVEAQTCKRGFKDDVESVDRPAKEVAKFADLSANVTGESAYYAFEASKVIETEAGLKVGFYGLTNPAVKENVQDAFVEGYTFA